jgi:hypothetical protein
MVENNSNTHPTHFYNSDMKESTAIDSTTFRDAEKSYKILEALDMCGCSHCLALLKEVLVDK